MNRSNLVGGLGVTAYVVDTGVFEQHIAFDGRARHGFTGKDAFEKDGTNDDLQGHGTHVAGCIGGSEFGTAHLVNIMAVKAADQYGTFTEMDVIEGLAYILQDVKANHSLSGKAFRVVVNLSFGSYSNSLALERTIRELNDYGIVIVTAAGNENAGSCFITPGRMPEVINVGATDEHDQLSSYSNWGSCVDLLAPGDNIVSASITGLNDTGVGSGTSYAAPLVSGVIANIMSYVDEPMSSTELLVILRTYSTTGVIDMVESYKNDTPNCLLHFSCTAYEMLALPEETTFSDISTAFGTDESSTKGVIRSANKRSILIASTVVTASLLVLFCFICIWFVFSKNKHKHVTINP